MTNRDELGNSVLRSAARLTRWASRNASFDVPMAQARLLALVEELSPARISALAAADHCSQPTMSTLLHRLEAEGWAERIVDPADARASLISLTTAGRAALDRVRQARLQALSPAFNQLDAAALTRLQEAVDALDDLLARASGDTAASALAASTRHTHQTPSTHTEQREV
jgi:DNA-binding MarR family transcriptional regulator